MKISLWLLTLAMGIMCFFLWVIARLETPLLKAAPSLVPPLTEMLFTNPNWLWFCPVPWILAAFLLSFRKEVSPAQGFVFLSTAVLAASLILFPCLLAAVLPWLALFGQSISHK
jgi:hypothetical protein